MVSRILVVVVTIGVVLAANMALAVWTEPWMLPPSLKFIKLILLWMAGLLGPVLVGAILVTAVWTTSQVLADSPRWLTTLRVGCWALALIALGGYSLAGVTFGWPKLKLMAANRAAQDNFSPDERAAEKRFRNTPVEQLLNEELNTRPSDTPLSLFVGYFVRSPKKLTDRCREMLVQRALAVPDMDNQLMKVMRAKPYSNRWGAAEFLRYAAPEYISSHHEAWAKALAGGIDETAEAMTIRPAWLSEAFDDNPEPLELVRSLLAAAERFKGDKGVDDAQQKMATSVNELTRDKKKKQLEDVMKKSGYPVPPDYLQIYVKEIWTLPEPLRELIKDEVRAGNPIVEISARDPAPPTGLCVRLGKPVSTRPRASFDGVQFFDRRSKSTSGEFSSAEGEYFVIEPPLPPEAELNMNSIRDKLNAAERASNAKRDTKFW